MTLAGRNLLDLADFSIEEISYLLAEAAAIKQDLAAGRRVSAPFVRPPIMLSLFYEPSTRTRLSFESAMTRLGGQVLSAEMAATTTSAFKGETLSDTGRVVSSYADVVVVRHSKPYAARSLAQNATVPVINGGDSLHPTQALVDLFTAKEEFGEELERLHIAIVGDLRHARTARSFLHVMARFGATFVLVSPAELSLDPVYRPPGVWIEETTDIAPHIADLDLIYMTRIQRERFSEAAYEQVKGSYRLTPELLEKAPEHLRVMHPLPRIDEISYEVDKLPQAAYFRQAANGVPMRMALLRALLAETINGAQTLK